MKLLIRTLIDFLVAAVLVMGCSSIPSASAVGSNELPPPSPSAEPMVTASNELIDDAIGGIHFERPATWFWVRPSTVLIPGPSAWLTSVALTLPCPPVDPVPVSCLAANGLPDGGIIITFGSAATSQLPAKTPAVVLSVPSASCATVGGDRSVSTRVGSTYIDACIHGSVGEAEFRALVATITQTG